ncbi:MAG: plasmid stabilization protein [Gammaproteobacteria bacterium]|nr:MAG: plasmid stabilization protein [Gammaproteobacteria bacterium]
MYKIIRTDSFVKKANKFLKKHPDLQNKLENIINLLTVNPFDSSLKTHKLKGNMKEFYSCSLDYKFRIILSIIVVENKVYLIDIGSHDEVY